MTSMPTESIAAVPDRLDVSHLSKTFGPARVLREVSLSVAPGEIHGLVGQNGCGKSTLVKILTGVYTPDPGGSVRVDGQALPLPINPPAQRAAGVSVVHQNLGLVDDRTVWENVRLGRYQARGLFHKINKSAEQEEVREVLARLGRSLDIDEPVGHLSAEDRAAVAIARALQDHHAGSGLIIFDESTRALGREARARFYSLVDSVLAGGASVVLISHQLEEVIETTDRVTVLRDGQVVESGIPTKETNEAGLMHLMLGRHLVSQSRVDTNVRDEVVATVSGVTVGQVQDFNLEVRRGEIVGLTGLIGAGWEELSDALGGARRARAGELVVEGRTLSLSERRGSTEDFIAAGVALVPSRRLEQGLASEMSVTENLTLPRARSKGSTLRLGESWQADEAEKMIKQLDIKPPNAAAAVGTLSGGNQQKVLLGKWLAGAPNLLVMQEPTQAVDVGARHDIIDAIRNAARRGCGVIVASIDAADLAVLCDRVLVFRDGVAVAELSGDLDQDKIVDATFAAPGEGSALAS
jgi:ribose transport system ATP-binding protein